MRTAPLIVSATVAVYALLLAAPLAAQDRAADVDRIFSVATSDTPGCVVGLSQHGKILHTRAYGLGDVERRVPMSANTRFDIGSTQKQFVAAAVLLLVQDGRLKLGDDVRKYVPQLHDYGHTITIDHLLTHTSGIRDWTGLLPLAEEGSDVLQLIFRQRGLNFTPGHEWSYSNSGYVLLKEIIARTSGMSFAAFAERRLFKPLGMTSSAYVEDITKASGERAVGYQKDGAGWKQYMRLGNERGGGAVVSTAGDLLLWNDALTSGKLGAFVTNTLQERAKLRNGRLLTYARGLMIDSIPGGRMVSHSGGAAGFSTFFGRFTDHGLSAAVMCNFDPVSATNLATRVADLYLPPVDRQTPAPGPVAVPGVDASSRAGWYFDTQTGEAMRVITNGGRIAIANGPPLVPVSAERFRPQRASLFLRSQDNFEMHFASNDAFTLTSMEGQSTTFRRGDAAAASAADLAAFEGRYQSDDLGQQFDILPSGNGLTLRFAKSPEKSLVAQPVARDTYTFNLMILRFSRDASGAVTGFDYSNPAVRNIRFTRVAKTGSL